MVGNLGGDVGPITQQYERLSAAGVSHVTKRRRRRRGFWILLGVMALLIGLQACGGGENKEGRAATPAAPVASKAPHEEAAISGTITPDPLLKDTLPKEPLLM